MKNYHVIPRLFLLTLLTTIIFSCESEDFVNDQNQVVEKDEIRLRAVSPFEDFQDWYPPAGGPISECEYISIRSTTYSCNGGFAFKILDGAPNGKYFTNTNQFNNVPTEFEGVFGISDNNSLSFNWESNFQVCAIIVQGGKGARVYYPENGVYGDTGLQAPVNPSTGQNSTIDNVTFCYSSIPSMESYNDCFEAEGAWAEGASFIGAGQASAAMYVPYTSSPMTVNLVADNKEVAGICTLRSNQNGMVDISISLKNNWIFYYDVADQNADFNMKVQDFSSPPMGYAIPGLFEIKEMVPLGALEYTMTVPQNAYYAVNLSLAHIAECQ